MSTRISPTFFDRQELLETIKDLYKKLHGKRPEVGLYDDLEIKALEAELADIREALIKKEIKND